MIIRLIIIFLLIYYYKNIVSFFNLEKNYTKFKTTIKKLENNIVNRDLNIILNKIKDFDRKTYKNIKKRIVLIENIFENIKKSDYVDKGKYDIIKKERKNILNILGSFRKIKDKGNIFLEIDKYILNILKEILNLRKEIDINWFEDETLKDDKINIEPFDQKIEYNYSLV